MFESLRSDRVALFNSTCSNTGGYAIELSMTIYIRTRLKCIYNYSIRQTIMYRFF